MAAWIFQAKPERYDLRERLRVGDVVPWVASRYRSEIREGDEVYFWLAGDAEIRGIYGRGRVVGEPFVDERGKPRIRVKVEKRYEEPLMVSGIRTDDTLQDLDILRVPIGTNFRLTNDQKLALQRHLHEEAS